MKSAAISLTAFILWIAAVMALTVTVLNLGGKLEATQAKQIEALSAAEDARPAPVARHNERVLALHNLLNTAAILLVGTIALGLAVFTILIYRLAMAARDAKDLIEFRGLLSAAEPVEATASAPQAPESQPLREAPKPELFDEEPAPDGPAREEKPVEPATRPTPTPVTAAPRDETGTWPALEQVLDALAPPDGDRRHRLELLQQAALGFPDLGDELKRLLELISQPKIFMHQLVREISPHPVLAQKLVRLANTLYYSPPKAVKDLSFALVVLGAEGLRGGLLAQGVHDAFEFSEPLQVELWHHSIATAIAAALLGRATGHPNPNELYAHGLVHCLGRMVFLQNRPKEYARLADIMHDDDVPAADVEREAFGFTHAEVGAVSLALWGMPTRMQAAVMYAHDHDAPGLSEFGRESASAAAILDAADAIAKKVIGMGGIPADADVHLADHPAVRALDLTDEQLAGICEDLREHYEEQRAFL